MDGGSDRDREEKGESDVCDKTRNSYGDYKKETERKMMIPLHHIISVNHYIISFSLLLHYLCNIIFSLIFPHSFIIHCYRTTPLFNHFMSVFPPKY